MRKIKKVIAMGLVLTTLVATMSISIFAFNNNTTTKIVSENDAVLNTYSLGMKELIKNKLESGEQVFYGEGTKAPSYLNKALNSRINDPMVEIPASGATYTFDIAKDETVYSPWLFNVTKNCNMVIYASCTSSGTPHEVKLEVVNTDSGREVVVYSRNITLGNDNTIVRVPVSPYLHYVKMTGLTQGTNHVAVFVD